MSAIVGWLDCISQCDSDLPKSIGDKGSILCGWCIDSTGVELWILSGCCALFSEANILKGLSDNLMKVVSLQILLPGSVTTMEESDFYML